MRQRKGGRQLTVAVQERYIIRFAEAHNQYREVCELAMLCTAKVEQALRQALNLIFYHLNCAGCVIKFQHILS